MERREEDKFWMGLALGMAAGTLIRRGRMDNYSGVDPRQDNYKKDGTTLKGEDNANSVIVVILWTLIYFLFISLICSSYIELTLKVLLLLLASCLYPGILAIFYKKYFWFGLSIAIFTITFLLSFWVFINNAQVIKQESTVDKTGFTNNTEVIKPDIVDNKNQLLIGNINTWVIAFFALFTIPSAVYYLQKLWENKE